MILFIITAIIIYYLFIHRNLKKLVPALGVYQQQDKGFYGSFHDSGGFHFRCGKEKLSNEAIIRDMVIEMEKDNESREHLFRSFLSAGHYQKTPQLKNLVSRTPTAVYMLY